MRPKPDKLMPSLYGGLIIAGISAIPGLNLLNCLCCAGVMLGGFLAVFFFREELTPDMDPLTMNDCLRLGIMAGLIAAVAGTIINAVVMMVFGNVAIEMMMRIVDSANVQLPPELQSAVEQSMREHVSFFGLLTSLLINLVVDTLFALVGGLIAWSVFKPKGFVPPTTPV